jgi:hypothetical protein
MPNVKPTDNYTCRGSRELIIPTRTEYISDREETLICENKVDGETYTVFFGSGKCPLVRHIICS